MQPYKNLSGDSGVAAYEAGPDFIKVEFTDGAVYLYNYSRTGPQHVEKMKSLAASGSGLNSYINTPTRKSYAQG